MSIDTYLIGKWTIEPTLNLVQCSDDARHLKPRAMDVLVHLLESPNEVVSINELLDRYWTKHTAEPRKIAKQINQIRNALDDDARNPFYIETIPKRGYRVIAPVSHITADTQILSSAINTGLVRSENIGRAGRVPAEQIAAADETYTKALTHMGALDFQEKWASEVVDLLEQTTTLNSEHSDAWSYLSMIKTMIAVRAGSRDFDNCVEAAQCALSINSQLALPHVALGYVALLNQWDLISAKQEFELALQLDPDEVAALSGYHLLLRIEEEFELAEETAVHMKSVAPRDLLVRMDLCKFHYESRLYDKAIKASDILRLSIPQYADFSESAALQALGRFTDSYQSRVRAYQQLGKAGEKQAALLKSGWQSGGYVVAMQMLSDYQLTIGENTEGLAPREFLFLPDRAPRLLALLQQAVNEHRPAMIGLLHNPEFDALRAYPAFNDLINQIAPGRQTNSAAKRADVARIEIFRGNASDALPTLLELIAQHGNDQRAIDWMESIAWAFYASEDYEQATQWSKRVVEQSSSPYVRARAHIVACASFACGAQLEEAQSSLESASQSWPDGINIDQDIAPLFFGGDQAFKAHFFDALNKVSMMV